MKREWLDKYAPFGKVTCQSCGRDDLVLERPNDEEHGWTMFAGDKARRPVCWDCAEAGVLSVPVDL